MYRSIFPPLALMLLMTVGCDQGKGPQINSAEPVDSRAQAIYENTVMPQAGRVITLPATPGSQVVEDFGLLPYNRPEPTDEIVRTVAEDGTVTLIVGNRLSTPLIVEMGCNGEPIKSHGDIIGGSAKTDCNKDLWSEEKR